MPQTKSKALSQVQGLLRARGKRITGQRALLLEIIQQSEGHLDAEELYHRARRRNPHINLATVYRTLNLLKDTNLVDQRYLSHDHHRAQFEPKARSEHHHFTCVACGCVIEFESPRVAELCQELTERFGVDFTQTCLYIEGYCSECAPLPD